MRRLLISAMLLAGVAPFSVMAQGFEPPGVPGVGQDRVGLALIDDTDVGAKPRSRRDGAQRFRVILLNDNAILLDSVSGNTWVLVHLEGVDQPAFEWRPIRRRDSDNRGRSKKHLGRDREIDEPSTTDDESAGDDPFDFSVDP